MRLFCVKKTGTFVDDKEWFDLVTHEEFSNGIVKDHEERLSRQQGWLDLHGCWLQTHETSIQDVSKTVKENVEEIRRHTDRICRVERELGKIPQALRETLDKILKESFVAQFEVFASQLAALKEERAAVARQLDELQQLRSDVKVALEAMKKCCVDVDEKLGEMRQQRTK